MTDELDAAAAAVDAAATVVDAGCRHLAHAVVGRRADLGRQARRAPGARVRPRARGERRRGRAGSCSSTAEHGDVESMLARAFVADAIARPRRAGARPRGRVGRRRRRPRRRARRSSTRTAHPRSSRRSPTQLARARHRARAPRRRVRARRARRSTASPRTRSARSPSTCTATNADIPEDIIAGLAELGGFGLSVPEEYGGFAAGGESDYLGMVVATEELSWGSLGVGGSLITRPEILTRAIVRGGTEEQKQRWLPQHRDRRADGRRDGDRARLRLRRRRRQGRRATPVDGGYAINGVKTWATFAGRAERAHAARPHRPRPRRRATAGCRCSSSTRSRRPGHAFAFDAGRRREDGRPRHRHDRLPRHALVRGRVRRLVRAGREPRRRRGGLGQGFYLQMEGFENGRLQTAARAVGLMQAAFEAGLAYAQERNVFGKPVFDYQLSQGEARPHGRADPGRPPVLLRRRPRAWAAARARSRRRW